MPADMPYTSRPSVPMATSFSWDAFDDVRPRHIAIIHYWLTSSGGGEKVLQHLLGLFPSATLFTHAVDQRVIPPEITSYPIQTTWIARLPFARRHPQWYLPLMPLALESLDLRDFDLVICSESGPTKGVLVRPDALCLCYCHSPMRYLWDMAHDYVPSLGPISRILWPPIAHYLRLWDTVSATRLDAIAANSAFVARRIRRAWGRHATVIYPPVDVAFFSQAQRRPEDFYLLAGRLVPYKAPQLAIQACAQLHRRLVVAGNGPLLRHLQRMAGANVTFIPNPSHEMLRDLLARTRALLFPGVEDFGLVPVEAMACGTPVIALGRGGALETVVDGVTGVLFSDPTPHALAQAILRQEQLAETGTWDISRIRAHAETFAPHHFVQRIQKFIHDVWTRHLKQEHLAHLSKVP